MEENSVKENSAEEKSAELDTLYVENAARRKSPAHKKIARLARHFLRPTFSLGLKCNVKIAQPFISNSFVFEVQFLQQQTCLNIVFAVDALES